MHILLYILHILLKATRDRSFKRNFHVSMQVQRYTEWAEERTERHKQWLSNTAM